MTPTTAEQMPDWLLASNELEYAAIRYKRDGVNEQSEKCWTEAAKIRKWLAQGGARGVRDLDKLAMIAVDGFNEAAAEGELLLTSLRHVQRMRSAVHDVLAATDAALAPRAEAGEAVLTNPHTGTPRDYRDVESDPEGILIAVPGEPLRPYKPTAACGVSGLVGRWREVGQGMNGHHAAHELEAALKANRGGVSEAQIDAAQAAYTDAFADGNTHRHSWRIALTAALNAGALAGGEAVPEPDPKHRQLVAAAILGAQFTSEGLGMLQHDDMTASDFNPDEGDKG